MYAHEGVITPIIIDCGIAAPKLIEFRSKLGLDPKKIITIGINISNGCAWRRKCKLSTVS